MAAAPRLVIFDCDGVLVDSERIAVRVDAELLAELGWPLSESAGKGGNSIGHGKLASAPGAKRSAYMFWGLTAIARLRTPFLDRKHRDR